MNLRPQAVQTKHAIVVVDRAPGRELMRHHTPRAAGSVQIQNSVDYLSHINRPRSTAAFGRRDQRFNELPLFIRQIAGIWYPFHILLYRLKTRTMDTFHTRS